MSCAALLLATQLSTCAPAVTALERCATTELSEMARSESTTYGTQTSFGANGSRKAISTVNRVGDAQLRCELTRRRAEALCGQDPDYVSAEAESKKDLARLNEWIMRLLLQVRQQTNNDRTGPILNCIPSFVDGISHWTCRLLDRTEPRARVVSSADLPLTVGMSSECTFTVLPDGRLLTASHCGEEDLKKGTIYQYYSWTPVTARFTSSLKVDRKAVFTGQPFEDVSVWTPESFVHGRPFYILVRDPRRAGDCEIQDDLYFVCGPDAFAELHRREAHVIGFPYARYRERDRAETVVLADGRLIYDPASSRLLIHAAMSQGGSGGPAYVDAGQTFGGTVLKRPLLLGPVTAISPPRPLPPKQDSKPVGVYSAPTPAEASRANAEINFADTLVIVGIVNASDLKSVLPPR